MSDSRKVRLLEDLDFASDRLSSQVRQISLGALALVWALLVGRDEMTQSVDAAGLLRVALLSVLTLSADFFQYVAGFLASRKAWESYRAGGDGKYDRKWPMWRARQVCFWAKIFLCGLNVLLMVWILGGSLAEW